MAHGRWLQAGEAAILPSGQSAFGGPNLRFIIAVFLFFGLTGLTLPPDAGAASAQVLSDGDLKIYKRAFKDVDRGRWEPAIGRSERASNPLPLKAIKWLSYQSATSPADFEEIAAFLRDHPQWPKRETLREHAEEKMDESVPPHAVLAFFAKDPPTTWTGFRHLARALDATARGEEIKGAARRFWIESRLHHSDEREFRRDFRQHLTPQDEVDRLENLLWDGHRTSASRQSKRVSDGYRRLAIARIRLSTRSGGVDGAIARVPSDLQDNPGLVYERLRWRRKKNRTEDAIALLAQPDLQESHPEPWWKERAILARRLMNDGDWARAYAITSEHRAKEGAAFAEAEWLSGWIALRYLNDPVKAFPHFERMYKGVGYPVSVSRAAYWAGRASEAGGQNGIAVQWYFSAAKHPSSFYGQLAAEKIDALRRPKLPPEPIVSGDLRDVFEANELPRLVRLLTQIGARDTVRSLVRHMARNLYEPQTLSMLAALATDIEREDLAVYTARQAIKRGIILPETGYPAIDPGRPLPITDNSILYGLIRQESGFDRAAISSAGARGLMQLMPATAKVVSGWEKIPYRRADLTTKPAYNMRLGSAYLADLLEKFDGALPLALAGYNAGPHRVTRWLKKYGDPRGKPIEDMIDWMENIPFTETRNYVQRVLENIAVYRQRDVKASPALIFTADAGVVGN